MSSLIFIGTIDFYPNGGKNQPLCQTDKFSHRCKFISYTTF